MFQKFGYTLPQDLIDAATKITEAKADEPAAPDADAIARRKRLQALKDKQEDDAAERGGSKTTSSSRTVAGTAYGGAKQKADIDEELKGDQHKIDANKNGKVDAHDFKLLRGKKKVEVDEAKDTVTKDAEGKVTSWSHESDWKKSKGTDGKGKVSNLSDVARRKTEKLSKEDVDFIDELDEGAGHDRVAKAKHGVNVFNKSVSKLRKSGELQGDFVTGFKKTVLDKKQGMTTKALNKASLSKEDVDFIDELNKSTLASYAKKASSSSDERSASNLASRAANKLATGGEDDGENDDRKSFQRSKGIGRAINRLTKEEQVDELSKSTLGSYVKKAAKDAEDAGRDQEYHGSQQDYDRGEKRQKGIGRAVDRLSKEEVELDERTLTSGETKEKEHLVKSMKKNKAGFQARYGDKAKSVMYATATKLAKESVDESRGHKIIATKLAQIDRMSTGVAPDHHVNPQSTSDKLKDKQNTDKVEIVTQKDTTIGNPGADLGHMDDKQKLNKVSHGYGKVQHTEEVEQADEAIRIKDTQGGYNLTKGAGKVAASDRKDAASVVKDFRKSWRAKGLSTKRYDANAQMDRGTGFAATKEEVEQADEAVRVKDTYGDMPLAKDPKNKFSGDMRKAAANMVKDYRKTKGRDYKNLEKDTGFAVKKEEVELDETATLDKYIKSMGYDPLNMEKNKKVMFAKTNAFKKYAQTSEDSKSPGQEDDVHMSMGATARG